MSNFKIASVFTDNMVLQKEDEVYIWGQAEADDKVEIDFCGQHKEAIAKDGSWKIALGSLNPGGPFDMFIRNKSNEIILKNILIGDVFVAAGQSNMEFMLKDSTIEKEELLGSNYSNIRLYTVPRIEYEDENKRIPNLEEGKWQVCSSETVEEFSAVAYYFVKKLRENLEVPIGIISCNKGGTSASCWMEKEYLLRDEEIKKAYLDEYLNAVNGLSEEEEDRRTAEYMRILDEYNKKIDEHKKKNPGISLSQLKKEVGHTPWPPPFGKKSYLRPCGLYETMLKKIAPYSVKAVLWYQGEEDTKYSELYKRLFSLLIDNWREEWHNNNLPFIFVQLPNYDDDKIINSWAVLRQAQLSVMKEIDNCHMIVSIDCGEQHNVHPANKKPVGERLALLVRKVIYNQNVNGYSPIYKSMELRDNQIIISFDFAEKQELIIKDGDELNGFEVCGSNNKFIKVIGKIMNNSVVLDCKKINDPKKVRYAWANYVDVNLYNKSGLPASPFIATID